MSTNCNKTLDVESLSLRERNDYDKNDSFSFFNSIINSQKFSTLYEKIKQEENLTNEEWDYLFLRFRLVVEKLEAEDLRYGKLGFSDKVRYFFSKICFRIFDDKHKIFNKACKFIQLYDSYEMSKYILLNMFANYNYLKIFKEKEFIDYLIETLNTACVFSSYRKEFFSLIESSSDDGKSNNEFGVLSGDEIVAINAMTDSYDGICLAHNAIKALVLEKKMRYNSSNDCDEE